MVQIFFHLYYLRQVYRLNPSVLIVYIPFLMRFINGYISVFIYKASCVLESYSSNASRYRQAENNRGGLGIIVIKGTVFIIYYLVNQIRSVSILEQKCHTLDFRYSIAFFFIFTPYIFTQYAIPASLVSRYKRRHRIVQSFSTVWLLTRSVVRNIRGVRSTASRLVLLS